MTCIFIIIFILNWLDFCSYQSLMHIHIPQGYAILGHILWSLFLLLWRWLRVSDMFYVHPRIHMRRRHIIFFSFTFLAMTFWSAAHQIVVIFKISHGVNLSKQRECLRQFAGTQYYQRRRVRYSVFFPENLFSLILTVASFDVYNFFGLSICFFHDWEIFFYFQASRLKNNLCPLEQEHLEVFWMLSPLRTFALGFATTGAAFSVLLPLNVLSSSAR